MVTVVGGVGAGVAGRYGGFNCPACGLIAGQVRVDKTAEQYSTALVRVGMFSVGAKSIVDGARQAEAARSCSRTHPSSQNRSERYLASNLEAGVDGGGGGDANQETFVACQAAGHIVGGFSLHCELTVGQMGVVDGRHDGGAHVLESLQAVEG